MEQWETAESRREVRRGHIVGDADGALEGDAEASRSGGLCDLDFVVCNPATEVGSRDSHRDEGVERPHCVCEFACECRES